MKRVARKKTKEGNTRQNFVDFIRHRIYGGPAFTTSVLSFADSPASHGLTLSDFDPTLLQPNWIPQGVWDSLLAVSTLKGPLDSVCTRLASNPSEWREWYHCDRSETIPLPMESGNSGSAQEDEGTRLTELQRLLMIRCLRPDRFETAMRDYVKTSLGDLIENTPPPFEHVLSGIKNSVPVLVLLPDHTTMSSPFKVRPMEAITQLAEVKYIW